MRSGGLSEKEQLILGLLISNQWMYGLEMVKASRRKLKRGTVYVTLSRMEEKGYISAVEQAEESGPPRRRYAITDRGRHVWALWQELGGVK